MQYELYLDVLLLTDFVMDLLVLFLTGKFLKLSIRIGKLFCAALLGSVMHSVILIVMLRTGELLFLIISPVIAAGMITIAFSIRNRGIFFKVLAGMMGISFMLSGIMQSVNPLQRKTALGFILTVAVSYTGIRMFDRLLCMYRRKSGNLYSVRLYFDERELTVTGLADTGNQLLDPIYKKPVHILEENVMKKLIPEQFSEALHFHLIPFHSIGKDRGLLPAVIIPRMVIQKEEGECEIREAVVAFVRNRISSDGRYQMILHGECIG